MEQPIEPCKECLVRPCCSEICLRLSTYVAEVLEKVVLDSDDKVLKNFSEQQVRIILSTAEIIKRTRNENTTNKK